MKAIFEGKILTVPNLLSFLRLCMVPLFLWIYLGLDEPLWAAGLLVLYGIRNIRCFRKGRLEEGKES